MALAGSMRLTTFLTLAAISGVGLLGLTAVGGWLWMSEPASTSPALDTPPAAALTARPASADSAPLRELDRRVIELFGRDLGSEKMKDVLRSGPKINVYQDIGKTSPNRVKIDLDRDESDDEKWTIDGAAVVREVSPADDGRYLERWTLAGDRWVKGSGAAAPTAAPAAPAAPADPNARTVAADRAVDVDVLSWRGKNLGSDKLKDVTSGKPYKINVYQDAGSATANRAKIDLDRDDKWDEKITFDGAKVTREVAPADDEVYAETWSLLGSKWVR